MLYNFMTECQCVLKEEADDYRAQLRRLAGRPARVGFMPAIIDDLAPVYALSCTGARRIVSPNFYIIPIVTSSAWGFTRECFEKAVNEFYQDDELQEQLEIELEEMILLTHPAIERSLSLSGGTPYNVVFCHITMNDGSERYLLIMALTPDECWKRIVEHYGVQCDILIDSHKGLGDYFSAAPLYRYLRETEAVELLPRYYFKGSYVHSSRNLPGFRLAYVIREDMPAARWGGAAAGNPRFMP